MGSTEKTAKTWGKKEWGLLIAALLVIVLLWNLVPYVYGLISGRRAYEKVKNFQPSVETYITIRMYCEDDSTTQIKITDLEQQKEIVALTGQLEYGGHYTRWGYMPFQKNRLPRPLNISGNEYHIVLRCQDVSENGHITASSDYCMGTGHNFQYPPKYDNHEPLFQYCEDLFEGIKTSN